MEGEEEGKRMIPLECRIRELIIFCNIQPLLHNHRNMQKGWRENDEYKNKEVENGKLEPLFR